MTAVLTDLGTNEAPGYQHVKPLLGTFLGQTSHARQLTATGFADASSYALTVRNRTAPGNALAVQSSAGASVMLVTDAGLTLTGGLAMTGNLSVTGLTSLLANSGATYALVVRNQGASGLGLQVLSSASANVMLVNDAGLTLTGALAMTGGLAVTGTVSIVANTAGAYALEVRNQNATLGAARLLSSAGANLAIFNDTGLTLTGALAVSGLATISTGISVAGGIAGTDTSGWSCGGAVTATRFIATTTTLCTNLNADLLDGREGSGYLDTSSGGQTKAGSLTLSGASSNLSVGGTLTATGALNATGGTLVTASGSVGINITPATANGLDVYQKIVAWIDASNKSTLIDGSNRELIMYATGTDQGLKLDGGNRAITFYSSGTTQSGHIDGATGRARLNRATYSGSYDLELGVNGLLTDGPIRFANNQALYMQDTGPTNRIMLLVDASSIGYVGSSNLATVIRSSDAGGIKVGNSSSGKISFFDSAVNTKQTVTGSRGGNAALQSLLSGLANYGLITDSSS